MSTNQQKSKRTSAKRRLDFGDEDNDNSVVVLEKEIQVNDEAKSKASFLVPATPEKKKRRRDNKQGISTYFSPVKATDAKKAAAVVVTPEQKDETEPEEKATEESQQHVPIYIHKNVGYQRRGEASISNKLKRVFDLVEEHYLIPADFESNRSFGPLSGTCFEERAVNAYEKGLLKATKTGRAVLICTYCGTVGHEADECPDLI